MSDENQAGRERPLDTPPEETSLGITMPVTGDHGAGSEQIGRPGQLAQSGEAQLATEQGREPLEPASGEGDPGETTPEPPASGPSSSPSYGGSGHEGLGAEGTTSGRPGPRSGDVSSGSPTPPD